MSKQPPVVHIPTIDPDQEWKQGLIGWLGRYRSIGTWILGNLSVAGIIGWFRLHPTWLAIPGFAILFGGPVLIILRKSRIHRARTDHQLHALCHNLRDHAARVLGDGDEPNGKRALFQTFNQRTAQDMADFFRVLTGDASVTSAIRLALKSETGTKEYKTFGRSSGMEAMRDSASVPIPATEGLPAKLTSARYQGVLLIPDIEQAIASKDYFKTPNDELPDCRSMMVCPINGWESGTKAMVGIVTIASRRLNAFEAWHTISLKAIADILGLVYPSLLARLMGDRRAGGTACLTSQPPKSVRKKR